MFFSREVTSTNSVCSILPAVLFETALFGIFTLLVAISTWILIRKGFNSLSTKAMLAATLVMYAAATVHWASQLDLFLILQKDAQLVQMICDDIFFFSSSGGSTVSTVFHQCASSAMLSVNIILSDTIVLWRAWILRSGRALRTLSILLLLGTIGTSALDTALNRASANVLFGQSFNENPMGIFVFPFSWTTNIYAASVIGYKAWQHRRLIRDHLQHGNARTRAEKVMALFVESGLVYCSLWAFLTANAVIQVFALIPNSQSGARLITAGNVFVDKGLIQLIGIYPTIVIILVSLDMAHCDRNFTYGKSIPVPSEIPLRRITVNTQNITASRAKTEFESIILVGDSFSTVGSFMESDESQEHGNERQVGLEKVV